MIIGIGSDILDIRRIERTIERHGDRFLERIFTTAERAKAEKRTERIRAIWGWLTCHPASPLCA